MSRVRVLVGTKKGAFILTSDAARTAWQVDGPHFPGWEMYHLKGSPVDPDRIYASQSGGWFGQVIQRSDDGGKTWAPVDNRFAYDGIPGTHMWYDGTPHPWEFKRVWHIEPSPFDRDTVFAGVEDAALFKSTDGGASWTELSGLRKHGTGSQWQPGAGGMCLHTIVLDPTNANRIIVAISAAGAFRSDDGGVSWMPINKGLRSGQIPDQDAEVGHCVHHIAMHPSNPERLFMQKHWDVMRSDNAGDQWHKISGDLPTDFGFPIEVHSHEPETIYVVPLTSDTNRFPLDGKLRVYRSRTGGMEWEALTNGLPQQDCYVNVLRDAMAVDTLESCGVYFGTTGGQVYCSNDSGDSWSAIVHDLPSVLSVEVADAAMIRVVLPSPLQALAGVGGEIALAVAEPVTVRTVVDAVERELPMLRGTIRDHDTHKRRPFIRFFACGRDLSLQSPDVALPESVASGGEPLLIVGAMAGG